MAGTDILAGVTAAQDTNYTTSELINGGSLEWFTWYNQQFNVDATGTADGMSVKHDNDLSAGNVKMILADASGNILHQTDSAAFSANTWQTIDFASSGTESVTLNDTVELWVGYSAGYHYMDTDGATWQTGTDSSGSFATPPDPLDGSSTNQGYGRFGLRLMGTIGGGVTDVNYHGTGRGIMRGTGRGIG